MTQEERYMAQALELARQAAEAEDIPVGCVVVKDGRVWYGAKNPKAGCCGSVLSLFQEGFNHRPEVYGGVLGAECAKVLHSFFRPCGKEKI